MAYRALVYECAGEYRFCYPIVRGVNNAGCNRVGDNGLTAPGHCAAAPVETIGDVQIGIAIEGATILVVARHTAVGGNAHHSTCQTYCAGAT